MSVNIRRSAPDWSPSHQQADGGFHNRPGPASTLVFSPNGSRKQWGQPFGAAAEHLRGVRTLRTSRNHAA